MRNTSLTPTRVKSSLAVRAVAGAAVLAIGLTACGGSSGGEATARSANAPAASTSSPAAMSNAAATQAAALRATLTQLLHDHVNLTAAVVQAATATGDPSSPLVKGAEDALGQNTQDLTDAIGSVYGQDAAKQFNGLWSKHIGFFVSYTLGDLKNDAAMKKQALDDLAGYRTQFAQFVNGATKGAVPADAVAKILAGHVQTLTAAIDAITSKSPDAASKTYEAAQYMSTPAQALSAAFSKQFPDKFPGDATSAGAQLRATLTGLLAQHVNQTAMVVRYATATGDPSSPLVKGAEDALGQNTQDLTDAIGSVYGQDAAKQFNGLWSKHIGFFVSYTLGDLKNDAAMKKQALDDLAGYRTQFAQFVNGATKGAVPADAVAKILAGHVQTLTAAIDAITSKSPDAASKTYEALTYMSAPAQALSTAFAAQFPDKFGG